MSQKPEDNPTQSTNSNLEDEVDKLLDEVEALTQEVLSESPATAEVPHADPRRQVAADDAGLAGESPLIQDGEPTSVDDIVADVDLELDRASRKLGHVMDPQVADDDADAPHSPASEESALEPDLEAIAELEALERELGESSIPGADLSPDTAETRPADSAGATAGIVDELEELQRSVNDLSGEVMSHAHSSTAAPEATPPPTAQPPKPPGELAADVESELDQLENLLSELEGKPAPEPPSPAPGPAIDAEVAPPETQPSAEEVALDADLETLLAAPPVQRGNQSEEAAADGIDLDSISVWALFRERLSQRVRASADALRCNGQDRMIGILDLLDRPFGRISPRHKELIGYCAIATVAMSGVAAVLAVFV